MDEQGMWFHKIVENGATIVFNSPILVSKPGMEIGANVISSTSASISYMGQSFSSNGKMMITVLGFETMTVPAGTFENCIKISLTRYETVTDGAGNPVQYSAYIDISWMAPEVGIVKQERSAIGYDYGAELISATVNGVHYGN